MKDVTISARIPEELSDQLSTLAQALRRNRSWVIEEALRGYIASETEFLAAIDEGLRAAENGDIVEHEAVNAIMVERRQRLSRASDR